MVTNQRRERERGQTGVTAGIVSWYGGRHMSFQGEAEEGKRWIAKRFGDCFVTWGNMEEVTRVENKVAK